MSGYKVQDTLAIRELFTISSQKFSDGYFFGGESHSYFEVVCVLNGKVGITAGKSVYVLSAGQMTFHRPHEFHAIWEEGDTSPEVIIFTFSALPFPKVKGSICRLSPELLLQIKDIYKRAGDIFIIEGNRESRGREGRAVFENGIIINGVRDGMDAEAERFIKKLELFLSVALESVIEGKSEYAGTGSENYSKILSVMEENIDANLSAGELAALAEMSVPTLEKTVYKYMKCGAVSYYNALRMERARSLLRSGMSVKETAFALGFANQNYFSACFKKRFGVSPSETKKVKGKSE